MKFKKFITVGLVAVMLGQGVPVSAATILSIQDSHGQEVSDKVLSYGLRDESSSAEIYNALTQEQDEIVRGVLELMYNDKVEEEAIAEQQRIEAEELAAQQEAELLAAEQQAEELAKVEDAQKEAEEAFQNSNGKDDESKPEEESKPETEGEESKPEVKPGEETEKPETEDPETENEGYEGSKPEVKPEPEKPKQKPEVEKPEVKPDPEVKPAPEKQKPKVKPEVKPAPEKQKPEPKPITETKPGEAYVVPENEDPASGAGYLSGEDFSKVVYSENLTTEKFVSSIGEQARYIAEKNNLYASVMIAQAILESGSGSSSLSKAPNYNLFGIKGAYKGKSINLPTLEDGPDGMQSISDGFRRYETVSESLQDYADLLTKDMRDYYAGVTKDNASTPEEAAQFLTGRYATDRNYNKKINGLIETYKLKRFDVENEFDVVGLEGFDVEAFDAEKNEEIDLNESFSNLAAFATSKLGYDYVWGGRSDSAGGYDCSGLVQMAYKEAFGITIPGTTYGQEHIGHEVQFDELQMGDLLFWNESGSDTHHVAMYLENGNFIQAPTFGDKVKITSMEEYTPTFARRVVDVEQKDDEKIKEIKEELSKLNLESK